MKLKYTLVTLLALGVTTSYASELVTNGDFEAGSTGWTEAATSGYELIGDYSSTTVSSSGNLGPPTNTAYLGRVDNETDSVAQSISTVSGATATFSFDYYYVNEDIPGYDYLRVYVGGSKVFEQDLGDLNAVTLYGPIHESMDASAFMDGTAKDVKFEVTTDVSAPSSAFIDNVSVQTQSVPEPVSTVALGFGALALMRKRRR